MMHFFLPNSTVVYQMHFFHFMTAASLLARYNNSFTHAFHTNWKPVFLLPPCHKVVWNHHEHFSSSSRRPVKLYDAVPKSLDEKTRTTQQEKGGIQEEYQVENDQTWFNRDCKEPITNLLVCGDGDLSFSASMAPSLHILDTNLISTVLEEKDTHGDVYQRSASNAEIIQSFAPGHEVHFGIDATELEECFPDQKFDRIQFNFPHWRGKANHKYNRQLIDDFLKSASQVLATNGEIHIALCEGQGGSKCKTLQGYRDTWTPNLFASQYGLMLIDVLPFSPSYNLSAHRGVDRGFKIGAVPEMYIFMKASDQRANLVKKEQMLCCRHELHIVLPESLDGQVDNEIAEYSILDITEGTAIQEIIESIVPKGIRVEIPERRILMKDRTGYDSNMALYLIVYCAEGKALQRHEADAYREEVEIAVEKHIPLRENRRGRLVSRPFPYYLLQSIIDDHIS